MEKSTSNLSSFTEQELKTLLKAHYQLVAEVQLLSGEIDFNYKITASDNKVYLLKVSRPNEFLELIDLQIAVANQLEKADLHFEIPNVVLTKEGNSWIEKEKDGNKIFIRLQTFIPGRVLAKVYPHTSALLESIGHGCGILAHNLQGFDHSYAHRFLKWNPSELVEAKKYRSYIKDDGQVLIADYFWELFDEKVIPALPQLRKSVVYHDANDYNILVNNDLSDPILSGIIDFGDVLHTQTINDLAIACAYACMDKIDPLETASHVIRGYHKAFPLEEKEIEILYYLIAARLTISVAISAFNKHAEPENEYLLISERPAWDLLKKWKAIHPNFAHYYFRKACGWEACPTHLQFVDWATQNRLNFSAVVDLQGKKVVPFNLRVDSLELGNNSQFDTIERFEETIDQFYKDKSGDIGVGGYGEIRPVYTTDAYLVEGNNGPRWRTVHIGLDIWGPAYTSIRAPYDGWVHSFQNNANERDYGPAIILEHKVDGGFTFYTLYGHLSIESLEGLSVGQEVKQGEVFASFGPAPENGNWPPHLHFQILLDTMGWAGDFPGVAFPTEADIWMSICPDPALMVPVSLPLSQIGTLNKEAILGSRKAHLGRSLSISYQQPLHMVRGYGQYLYEADGRRYLDTVNNVAHVGHEHPKVVRAAQKQMAVLNTNTRYLHEEVVRFAEELAALFPDPLSVVHFVNSGSEANELALRMAHTWSGSRDMIGVQVGYHGSTVATVDVSSYKFDGKAGKGAPPHTHIVPIPDTFRGLYRDKVTAGPKYAEHIKATIENLQRQDRNIAGFICESILSCGGQIPLPPNYLKEAFKYVRAAGGLCIIDEVQVGFGRVGEHFWGFELQGVVPDIVTMGKPIGNGHPLGAVVTTPAIAQAFANGMEYFSTFGGNPVSSAIGRSVLNVIKEEGLQENALKVGEYLREGLDYLQQKYPIIGDIRGPGLFTGFELVEDLKTLEPAAKKTAYLANRMRQLGVLMSTDGPFYNVIKIKPPMVFNKQNVDFLIDKLDKVFGEDFLQQ